MAEKRKRTDKMVVKDGAVDNPQRAKRKYLDDEMVNNETGQLDGKAGTGKKRKRPVPKELKKRKQQRMDEETVSESEGDGLEQKEKKKSRAGAGAKAKTGLYSHDDSDTVSSTSQTWGDEQVDDKDDDRDSASEKDEAEEEPMDCEEAREHTIRDTSIPKSMLKPDGSKTQRGHSTAFRSVEQHTTSPHGKQERAAFDEADTASLRIADEIRRGERDMPHFSFIKGSESNFSRKSIKKTTGATAHLGHRNIRQRYDKVRFSEESTIPLQKNTNINIKTSKTYHSSAYTRNNKVEMNRTQIAEEKVSSPHSCTKSCLRLVLILLVLSVIWTFATVIPKHELVDNVRAFILQKSDHEDGIMSSLLSSGCQKRKRSDRYDVLEQEKDLFHKQYPNLKESIFTIIAGASFDHVEDSRELVRPVVLLLVGKQGTETKVNDVAASVATMYANVFLLKRPEHDVIHIHGPDLEKYPDDEAREEVHTRVEEGFKNCGNVVLITDVDRLPPCSAILFHGYCDNDGAPYKDAVFIFTMTLETNLPEGAHAADVERAAQAQLNKAWSRCPEEFSKAKMVAMHSRIANNIVLI